MNDDISISKKTLERLTDSSIPKEPYWHCERTQEIRDKQLKLRKIDNSNGSGVKK